MAILFLIISHSKLESGRDETLGWTRQGEVRLDSRGHPLSHLLSDLPEHSLPHCTLHLSHLLSGVQFCFCLSSAGSRTRRTVVWESPVSPHLEKQW